MVSSILSVSLSSPYVHDARSQEPKIYWRMHITSFLILQWSPLAFCKYVIVLFSFSVPGTQALNYCRIIHTVTVQVEDKIYIGFPVKDYL